MHLRKKEYRNSSSILSYAEKIIPSSDSCRKNAAQDHKTEQNLQDGGAKCIPS